MLHEHKDAVGVLRRNLNRGDFRPLHVSDLTQKAHTRERRGQAPHAHNVRSSAMVLVLAGCRRWAIRLDPPRRSRS